MKFDTKMMKYKQDKSLTGFKTESEFAEKSTIEMNLIFSEF
jgi:hypothetical protein